MVVSYLDCSLTNLGFTVKLELIFVKIVYSS